MIESRWLEEFKETCQDIIEDAFLLDAVSMYIADDCYFLPGDKPDCSLRVYHRLCDYLSQHVAELHRLEKKIGTEPAAGSRSLTWQKKCGKLTI